MTIPEFIVEVAESLKTGRRRFVLASVTTVFGMFLVVLLMGAGISLARGIRHEYSGAEKKFLLISEGKTSMPYEGRSKGVPVKLSENDMKNLVKRYPDEIKSVLMIANCMSPVVINGRMLKMRCYGIKGEWKRSKIFYDDIYRGRDFCERDFATKNKCCLISEMTAERYFGVSDGESVLSRYIEVNGICFQIIGIFTGLRGDVDTNFILFPSTTIMSLWKMEDKYSTIELNMDLKHLQTEKEEKDFITNVRKLIGKEHRFDYRDEGAVAFNSLFGAFRQVNSMLGGMRMTILLFCIFILISEIFGVSNILFISVRERTYEIVLRRLMGASDANIFSLVLSESVVVMLLSSIVGIFLAEGALRLLDSAVTFMWNGDRGIWGSFVVDIPILTGVMLATIVSGIIAGVAPAKRAVKLKITEVHG